MVVLAFIGKMGVRSGGERGCRRAIIPRSEKNLEEWSVVCAVGLQCITVPQESHRIQTDRQEDRSFRFLQDKWLHWAKDPSFVEEVLNCQIGKGGLRRKEVVACRDSGGREAEAWWKHSSWRGQGFRFVGGWIGNSTGLAGI